jgi:hypothetical protein
VLNSSPPSSGPPGPLLAPGGLSRHCYPRSSIIARVGVVVVVVVVGGHMIVGRGVRYLNVGRNHLNRLHAVKKHRQ